MPLRRPFKAVPIRLGPRYRRQARLDRWRETATVMGRAVVIGLLLAIGSVLVQRPALSLWRSVSEDPAATLAREQTVSYSGCDDVRRAGAAPIYAGEPGYRADMDGDADGIACEPIRR